MNPPLSAGDLEAVLAAIHVAAPVHAMGEIASTNEFALELAMAGAPEWTLVSAAHQTAGKGRRGRTWTDVPGRALMVSVVLRPTIAPARAGLISLLAGAAAARAIRDETGLTASCKWPNDVRLGSGKVGGVLGETRVERERLVALVLGLGINLDVAPRRLLTRLVRHLHEGYGGPDEELPERVKARWLPVADTIGREIAATATTGERIRGRAIGIDGFGGLVVSTDGGERSVAFGELIHVT